MRDAVSIERAMGVDEKADETNFERDVFKRRAPEETSIRKLRRCRDD